MAAQPCQHDFLSLDPVDQEKVGPDVALPVLAPFSFEMMIAVLRRQGFPGREDADHLNHVLDVLPGSGDLFVICLESGREDRGMHARRSGI